MTIKQKIRSLLLKNNISFFTLANRTGISIEKINSWKHNKKPTDGELCIVAHALNTTLDYLITGKQKYNISVDLIDCISKLNNIGKIRLSSYLEGLIDDEENCIKKIATAKAAAFCKEVAIIEMSIIIQ